MTNVATGIQIQNLSKGAASSRALYLLAIALSYLRRRPWTAPTLKKKTWSSNTRKINYLSRALSRSVLFPTAKHNLNSQLKLRARVDSKAAVVALASIHEEERARERERDKEVVSARERKREREKEIKSSSTQQQSSERGAGSRSPPTVLCYSLSSRRASMWYQSRAAASAGTSHARIYIYIYTHTRDIPSI